MSLGIPPSLPIWAGPGGIRAGTWMDSWQGQIEGPHCLSGRVKSHSLSYDSITLHLMTKWADQACHSLTAIRMSEEWRVLFFKGLWHSQMRLIVPPTNWPVFHVYSKQWIQYAYVHIHLFSMTELLKYGVWRSQSFKLIILNVLVWRVSQTIQHGAFWER